MEEKTKKWQVWLENKKTLNRDFSRYFGKMEIELVG